MRSVIIPKLQDRDEDREDWEDAFQSTDDDALPGRIPSFEEVLIEAAECEDYKHDESNWNREAHLRLLEEIYRHALGKPCNLSIPSDGAFLSSIPPRPLLEISTILTSSALQHLGPCSSGIHTHLVDV